ncbi:MAG: DNA internalization-related competence protein ComEC/Rec2 [Bacilli bacterium]|nr:DNA internalization-related competence protein ComEC/Rec2 [Bacilli bacterium]
MLRLRVLLQSNYIYYLLLILAFIFSFTFKNIIILESKYNINDNQIIGKITKLDYNSERYKLEVKANEKIIAYFYPKEDINLELGMIVLLKGELYLPINNTIPNTFNYKKYLNNHYIYYQMKVSSIDILKENHNIIYKIKNYINQRIDSFSYTNSYLKALILGDLKDLEDDVYKGFQINGVIHLFAISGMHINLLAASIILILNKIKIKETLKQIIIISFLIIFCLVVNTSASVYRSLIFYILLTINKIYDFNISTKNVLFLTIFFLTIFNPLIIFDLGFQYSAITTYGLVISIKKKKYNNYFKNLLYISYIAFLFSSPITLINFYEISLLSPFNNLIFGPLITLIIYPLSLLTIVISLFEPLLYFLLKFMENINLFISSFTLFNLIIPKVNIIFYLGYYLLIIFYIYSLNKKYLLFSLLLILSIELKPFLDNNDYVYFLDVGQGDSALIYNKKESILIDTGGVYNYDISNNTIVFFKSLGINKIDLLLLTHGDSDHLKDAPNIIKNLKVKNVMLNKNEYNELEENVLKSSNNIIDTYQSSFDFKIYNNYLGKDENSSSILSLLTINNTSILFMGDAPKNQELKFLKDKNPKASIIKLGHHGSKTSSDYNFLKSIGARDAIISSGRNNRYNHPSPETIETLKTLNIKYYDTKEKGTICYIFRHNNYTKKFYLP